MIKYKVKCKKIRMDLSQANLESVALLMLTDTASVADILSDLWNGNLSLKGYRKELEGLLAVDEDSERVFSESSPIASRRAAISHSQSLYEVIMGSGEYSRVADLAELAREVKLPALIEHIQQHLGGKLNLFNIEVCMVAGEEELPIALIEPAGEDVLNNWTKELSLYEENGFDIGGAVPCVQYVAGLQKVLRVLPDVAPLFY